MVRTVSFYERNEQYKCTDYIAPVLMPDKLRLLVRLKVLKGFCGLIAPKGMYEYMVARTKYIDELLEKEAGRMKQVLVFGAGFDTRSFRFGERFKNTSFFELDSPATQKVK